MKSSCWRTKVPNHFILLLCAFIFINALSAFAGPSRTTYQAKIIKPDGYPLEASTVNFKFTILDPAGSCILYAETYSSVNMSSTSGLISFALGSGVKTYPASATTFEQVFSNITPSLSCDVGGPTNYTPATTDTRKIVMQFHDGSGWQTLPAMSINAVPYAMYANEATKLNGLTSSDFIQLSTVPTCTASEALRYTGAGFTCVAVGNSVTSGTVVTALGYTPADGVSVTALSSSLTTTNTNISSVSSTVFSVSSTMTSLQNSVAASFATITSSQWTTSGTTINYMNGKVGIGTTTPVTTLDVSGGVRIGAESTTCAPALAGALRYNASNVEYCNGISWQAFGVSGAGITNFNGSTSGTQSFSTGTGGTAPNFATANGVHTLSIPLASTGSVTAGLISNTDYTTFTNKITSSAASIAQVLGYLPADNAASGTYAQKANNLSDLTNVATARANLGLGTFATASSIDLGSASATGTLDVARLPAFTGDATIAAASNTIILSNSGVTAGTYTKVTVDAKGRVTSSSALALSDVTTALGYTPANSATITSSQWNTSGTTINYMNGNIGVGTVSPGMISGSNKYLTLGIAGNNGVKTSFEILSGGNGTQGTDMGKIDYIFRATSGNDINTARIAAQAGTNTARANLAFYTTGSSNVLTQKMIISEDGNVGIGTSNPTAKLHLTSGTASVAPLKFTSGTLLSSAQSGTMEYDGFNFYLTDSTNARRTIATGSSAGSIDNASVINSTGNISMVPVGSVIVSSTTSSTSTSTGALIVKGGAGIAGDINVGGSISGGNTGQINFTGNLGDGSGGMRFSSVGSVDVAIDTDNNDTIRQFRVMTDGSDRASATTLLAVTEAGNVGIGTITPNEKLDLSTGATYNTVNSSGVKLGNSNADSVDNGKSSYYVIKPGGNATGVRLDFIHNTRLSGTSFTGETSVVSLVNGNVGIGTSNPQTALQVATISNSGGDKAFQIRGPVGDNNWGGGLRLVSNDATTTDANIIVSTNGLDLVNTKATPLRLFTNATERMRIDSSGSVGIGTSAPATRLHIVDNNPNILTLERTNNQNSLIEYKNTVGSIFAGQVNGTTNWGVGTGLDLGATGVFQVTPTGRVYIGGTTAPLARLQITPGTSSVAPIKLGLGVLLTSPQSGTIEYDGSDYYVTDNAGVRRTIATATTGGVLTNTNTVSSTSGITLWPASGNSVTVSSTVASTNSQTGALIVGGGLGVAGNINASGTIITSSNIQGASITATSGMISPYIAGSIVSGGALTLDSTTHASKGKILMAPNGGNIGVGIANPDEQLHLSKVLKFTNTAGVSQFRSPTTDSFRIFAHDDQATGNQYGTNDNNAKIFENVDGNNPVPDDSVYFVNHGTSGSVTAVAIKGDGKVGIGNSAPAAMLEIGKNASGSSSVRFVPSPSQQSALRFTSDGSANWVQSGLDFTNDSKKDIKFSSINGVTTWMTLQASTGNLGIGTTTPDKQLTMHSTGVDNYIHLTSSLTGTTALDGVMIGTGSSGDAAFYNRESTNMLFLTSNTERVRIDPTGNVGIGTTSPSYPLHVNGTVYSSSNISNMVVGTSGQQMEAGNSALTTLRFDSDAYRIFAGGAGEIVRITETGNVGIGTTAPEGKLEIKLANTTYNAAITKQSDYGDAVYLTTNSNPHKAALFLRGSDKIGAGIESGREDAGTTWKTYLAFMTNNLTAGANPVDSIQEKMRITADGNVGIGTTNPQSLLQISRTAGSNGNLILDGNSSSTGKPRLFIVDTNGGSVSTSPAYQIYNTNDLFSIGRSSNINTGPADIFNINNSGNVGIGTSSPVRKLSVHDVSDASFIFNYNNGTHTLYGGADTNQPWFGTSTSSDLRLVTSSTEQMRITSGGNVGIGTTTPTQKLSVVGDISVTGQVTSRDFFEKTVSIADGWAIGDYVEIVQGAPGAAGGSSTWEVHLGGTRNSWTEGTTYIITGTHSAGSSWREAPHSFENGYVGNSKCFTVDVNGNTNAPQFRIRAIKASASCGVAGTSLPLNFRIRSIGINASWTNLSAMGTGATVVGMQSMGMSWNVYTGNPQNNGIPAIHASSAGNVGIGTSAPVAILHSKNAALVGGNPATSGITDTAILQRIEANTGVLDIGMQSSGAVWLQPRDRTNLASNFNLLLNSNGGNVGIGITNPTYQLQLSTDSAAKPGTSTWTIASDARLKNIRAPFTRGIAALNGLNTVYFNYKQDNPLGLPSSKEFVGIKAQDVLKVIPEAVSQDDAGYFHVTNDSIIWTAVNAIKELYHKLIGVEVEIKTLKVENAVKDRKIQSLEQENAAIKAYLCSKDPAAPICK